MKTLVISICRSPLELPNLDENDRNSIDKMLSDENSDQLREENLTILFWKVISKTRQVLKLQLDKIRDRRKIDFKPDLSANDIFSSMTPSSTSLLLIPIVALISP